MNFLNIGTMISFYTWKNLRFILEFMYLYGNILIQIIPQLDILSIIS
jgi:hypothetical protein